MKIQTYQILIALVVCVSLGGCKGKINDIISPISDNGSVSAKVDGASWSGAYCYGLASGSAGKVTVVISGSESAKTVTGEDKITITLTSYTGKGDYNITGKAFGAVNLVYKGSEYIYDFGTGTEPVITVTESSSPESILKPGKIVGEFSGTLTNKKAGKSINVTSGKFTCKWAL